MRALTISDKASKAVSKIEEEYGITVHSRQMLALIDLLVKEGSLILLEKGGGE